MDAGRDCGRKLAGLLTLAFVCTLRAAFAAESLVVTTVADEDNGTSDPANGTGTSLREAIIYANNHAGLDTITFNIPVAQQVNGAWMINLATALPELTQSTTIMGPGAKFLTVRRVAAAEFRIFTISASSLAITISGITIRDGKFSGFGAGIFCNSPLTLTNCYINANVATNGWEGGGVALFASDGTFVGCTFGGNLADVRGGGIHYEGAGHTLTMQNCTVSGNNVSRNVGLCYGSAKVHVGGGGIHNYSDNGTSTIQLTNCTIVFNRGNCNGGIYQEGYSGGTAITRLSNTLLENNDGNTDGDGSYSWVSQGYNLAAIGSEALTDPTDRQVFGSAGTESFGDHGGTTPTWSLARWSPALDKGNSSLPTDQRGVLRPQLYNIPDAPGGNGSDIGAYEYGDLVDSLQVTTKVDENDGTSDPLKGAGTSLREAIIYANSHPGADTITIALPASEASGGTWVMNLDSALPNLTDSTTINGPGAKVLSIRRNTGGNYRIFTMAQPGLSLTLSDLFLTNGLVTSAPNAGGAVYSLSPLTLNRCMISGNSATIGGAVYLSQASGSFHDSTFMNNTGEQGGAITYTGTNGTSLVVDNCTITNNNVTGAGLAGAINFVGGGGDSSMLVANCTVAGNTSTTSGGGGIRIFASGGNPTTAVNNTIFASNSAPTISTGTAGGTVNFISQGYNLSTDAAGGFLTSPTDQVNTNPLLAPLQDNTGPVLTCALGLGSPAIDKGKSNLLFDARGRKRPVDLNAYPNAISGNGTDIGAYEYTGIQSTVVTTLMDEDGNTSDPDSGTGTSLREAINYANSSPADEAIQFSGVAFAPPQRTITLNGTKLPPISGNGKLSITAPSAGVILNGNHLSRVLEVQSTADVTLTRLTITNGNADLGAGLYNAGGLYLNYCTLTGNTASSKGGGFYNVGATEVNNSVFLSNSASGQGGGIFNDGPATLNSSPVFNNSAGEGGGLYHLSSVLNVNSCTFSGNSANYGGGVYSIWVIYLNNCTLAGNTANSAGGGLYANMEDQMFFSSSTFTNNTAPAGQGSGIAGFELAGAVAPGLMFRNCIVAGNANTDIDVITIHGDTDLFSQGYNLIGDGNEAPFFAQSTDQKIGDASPGLGPLQNNGGPTFTCAVLLGSPALNTGNSEFGTDQRGLARPFGTAAERGAYELQAESYAFWSSYIFPPSTPAGLVSINADADGDGILNGLEQALGLDPLTPDASLAAVEFFIQGNNLVLRFERSVLIDPARLIAEHSITLAPTSWSSAGITYMNLGIASPTTELIQALIPINSAPKKFGRLRLNP